MANADEVYGRIQDCLVDALGVDEDEVTPDARLADDLGAESIDYLDIIFRIEKAFGIKIDRSEMFPEDIFNNPEYVQDGEITPEGLTLLKERMPFADLRALQAVPRVTGLRDLFTVQTIVNYVASKV